ncbi:hypothetical protein TNCT_182691 [Trichonephila clavata]|uniref:Uncharacterized protein n=1 Tax=Trichonephila clavata TaxID=2740835 RepID=A0A8X6LSI4_TRICU|nr:hypothetical protein TNCT_182691 [Trichonephila clavata]
MKKNPFSTGGGAKPKLRNPNDSSQDFQEDNILRSMKKTAKSPARGVSPPVALVTCIISSRSPLFTSPDPPSAAAAFSVWLIRSLHFFTKRFNAQQSIPTSLNEILNKNSNLIEVFSIVCLNKNKEVIKERFRGSDDRHGPLNLTSSYSFGKAFEEKGSKRTSYCQDPISKHHA